MRKSLPIIFTAALAAAVFSTPDKAKAGCKECWAVGAGALVVGGAIAAGSYAHGYNQGYYEPEYGRAHYYAPRRAATFGYYSPPYYDYGDEYYQRPTVRYVKKVRYVRQEYVEPVYYAPPPRPVYYERAPEPVYYQERPNHVRVRN